MTASLCKESLTPFLDSDILIIGAGASGLTAAINAAVNPFSVLVLERNDVPGKKLAITGKGRCNATNAADIEESVRKTPGNGKFLYSAFSGFPNSQIVSFFADIGAELQLERGGRYFTKSGDARDVVKALHRKAEDVGANFLFGARARTVRASAPAKRSNGECIGEGANEENRKLNSLGRRFEVTLFDGRTALSDVVIVATGGLSYPATGSTGDGYAMAGGMGHTIVPPRPSLVPLETSESWPKELAGLSLRNVGLKLFGTRGNLRYESMGEALFTHFGISGPIALSGSRHILDDGFTGCKCVIDMKPALSIEKLEARVKRDLLIYARKSLKNAMADLLPSRLIPVVIEASGLDGQQIAANIGKRGVSDIAVSMKNLTFNVSGSRPVKEAIVTAGGVKTTEINPSTMESKLTDGLFFCGETMDVDAYTGGFNLSIAFSTGALAGKSAARRLSDLLLTKEQ